MSDLKKCAGPGCSNLQDPRWSDFCDGHGPSTEEERQALLDGWRAQNEKVAQLEASRELATRLANETIARILDEKAQLEAKVSELEALQRESEWRIEALKKQRDAERERCARIVDPAASGFGAVPYREERKRLAEAIRRGE